MNILGITHLASWNQAACLITDGRLIAFAEEERFIRQKHAPGLFPWNAIKFCLTYANVMIEEIDVVAVGFGECASSGLFDHGYFESIAQRMRNHLDALGIPSNKVRYYSHHIAHAASTFPCSGYAKGNILSIDGSGEDCAGIIGFYDDFFSDFYSSINTNSKACYFNRIIPATHSWGELWSDVTEILGFYRHSGEGKTMGLAPYGEYDETVLPDYLDKDGFPDNKRYKDFFESKGYRVQRIYQACPTTSVQPMTRTGQNLAKTLQTYYNRFILKTATDLQKSSGSNTFSITGGCGLNCSANGYLAKQSFVDCLYTQPASHDAGTALGSAVMSYWEETGRPLETSFNHSYWGEEFSDEQIRDTLIKRQALFMDVDPVECTAELLANNRIVGFFQGRAEIGPRALGNRSILANPCYASNLNKVNAIKGRENWRPLSPSVLEDDYFDVVDCKLASPFMLLAAPVRDYYVKKIPAVVHVDGSCRPQTVDKHSNPIYYKMINQFKKLTGVPVVLNTSYNLAHEPIVNTPDDAMNTFFASDLDALVIGNFLVTKKRY